MRYKKSRKNPNSKAGLRRTELEKLKSVFGNRCWYCGSEYSYTFGRSRINVEHITPKSKGGLVVDSPFEGADAMACGNCNRAKSNQSVTEFLKWLAYVRSSEFQCFILSKLPKSVVEELEDYEWDLLRKEVE